MVTQSEIIKALKVIQRVCNEASDCPYCPLRSVENDKSCSLTEYEDIPKYWELNDPSDWRAFK